MIAFSRVSRHAAACMGPLRACPGQQGVLEEKETLISDQ